MLFKDLLVSFFFSNVSSFQKIVAIFLRSSPFFTSIITNTSTYEYNLVRSIVMYKQIQRWHIFCRLAVWQKFRKKLQSTCLYFLLDVNVFVFDYESHFRQNYCLYWLCKLSKMSRQPLLSLGLLVMRGRVLIHNHFEPFFFLAVRPHKLLERGFPKRQTFESIGPWNEMKPLQRGDFSFLKLFLTSCCCLVASQLNSGWVL